MQKSYYRIMGKLISAWRLVGKLKYVVVITIGVLVIGLIGEYSFVVRCERKQQIADLKSEIKKYTDMHKRDSMQVKNLDHNPRYIEKIARERYLMKADDEDIFVLSDDMK